MTRAKTIYTCQHCGAQSPKWLGKCPDCGEWNSYVEETFLPSTIARTSPNEKETFLAKPLDQIDPFEGKHLPIGLTELDRVLGGGIVPASAILIGGEPGIGKSTLILQALGFLAHAGKKVLYISGEESLAQIKMRSQRIGIPENNLLVATENCLENLLVLLQKEKPKVIAVDSVQTIYSNNLTSAPGTVSQIREATGQIITLAKKSDMACFFVGHVTKEGAIAGPKVLEHMVDSVLYFESDLGHAFRILRAVKNRFGATNEIGVFEMTAQGLQGVQNPSHLFLQERSQNAAGSVVVSSLEGTRPLLLEIQALVTHSGLANPRRTAIGADNSRVALLVAVLEKIVGLPLYDQDIFINVAGGLKVNEPALDLGITTAIFSSFRNLPLNPKTVLIGEVGLTGEIRAVSRIDIRLKEAAKLGFEQALIPKVNAPAHSKIENLKITSVGTVGQGLDALF